MYGRAYVLLPIPPPLLVMPIIVVGFARGSGKSRTEKGQETEEGQGREGSSTTGKV